MQNILEGNFAQKKHNHAIDITDVAITKVPTTHIFGFSDLLTTARKNQLMMMHNHPSTGTFSGEDFKTFCNNDSIYVMTVIGNDASIYILVKTKDFDKNVLFEYARIAQKYYEMGYKQNNGTMAMKYILKNASKYGIEYKKGRN